MHSRLPTAFHFAVLVSLTGCLVILGIGILWNPKSLDWDSRRGMLAAMQYEQGVSPSIVQNSFADPDDLNRTVFIPEAWRSPGYQAVPLGLRFMGLPWGSAIKVTILLFFTIGIIAWMACYREAMHGQGGLISLSALIVLSPIVVDSIRSYDSGDLLLFGYIPLMIWVNMIALRQKSKFVMHGLSTIGGLLSTSVFVFKYSGIFVGMGIGAAWLLLTISCREYRQAFLTWMAGALSGASLIVGLGYPWGPTPSSTIGQSIHWKDGLLAFGAWPLSMTDSAEFVSRIGEMLGASEFEMRTVYCPFLGLLFVGVIVGFSRRELFATVNGIQAAVKDGTLVKRWPCLLLVIPFIIDTLSYAGIVFAGGGVEVCARLARPSALLIFPLITELLWRKFCEPSHIHRAISFLLLVLFVAPGPAMGASRVIRTALSLAHDSQTLLAIEQPIRIEGVGNNLSMQSEFYAELRKVIPSTDTVLLVTGPEYLLNIPLQRCLLVYAVDNQLTKEELAALRFRGRPSFGVAMLLPAEFTEDGRASALQAAFQEAEQWSRVQMRSDPRWTLWLSPPGGMQ